VDKNEKHFRELRLGLVLFYESGLEDPVSRSVDQGRLSFAGLEGLAELASLELQAFGRGVVHS
jgi:hypothetical protein